ncbi:MAG: hypothetical protein SVX43_16890 [Cyanobacteriota bacterium]|nr:hypothetical protein [Cyanobacteriota bacterium]
MSSPVTLSEKPNPDRDRQLAIFRISPIIRGTLLTFYLSLTLPLPFLARVSSAPIAPGWLWLGIGLGAIALVGASSERVILDVAYPVWVPPFFRQGWSLKWSEIEDLKLRTTGQGGLVYYFVTRARDRAYLLPARVAGFSRLVKQVEQQTGIDTSDIRPLAQPWMYLILLGMTVLLLLAEGWALSMAIAQSAF